MTAAFVSFALDLVARNLRRVYLMTNPCPCHLSTIDLIEITHHLAQHHDDEGLVNLTLIVGDGCSQGCTELHP